MTMTGRVGGQVGSIIFRDVQITWDGPVPGDEAYHPGDDAHLQLTIINNATTADQGLADRLVAVHSPIALASRIEGDTRVPDGHVIAAGYEDLLVSITVPGAKAIDVVLVGLTEPVRAGLTYPVSFVFERAGELRLEVPVENPDILSPRAR
jgi:hypothetical protein